MRTIFNWRSCGHEVNVHYSSVSYKTRTPRNFWTQKVIKGINLIILKFLAHFFRDSIEKLQEVVDFCMKFRNKSSLEFCKNENGEMVICPKKWVGICTKIYFPCYIFLKSECSTLQLSYFKWCFHSFQMALKCFKALNVIKRVITVHKRP